MSSQPSNYSEKPKKKSKKLRPRSTFKKTQSRLKDKSSTKCSTQSSTNVEPPSTVIKSVDWAILKWNQEEPRELDPYEDGDFSKMPHEAPNEVNFVGGIGATNIGHRRSNKFIDRTTKIQQIFNMRNDNKTVFNFCEDPQLTNNVPSRGNVNKDDDNNLVRDTVGRIGLIKHEQLPIEEEESNSSSDFKHDLLPNTELNENFKDDPIADNKQNNFEIRKHFLGQKRTLLKQQLETEVPQLLGNEYRKKKFKLSEYFDVDKNIPEDIDLESVREAHVDWTEKYKVESHLCDLKFARPMPEIISMPKEREKLAFLTRTLDKPRNIETLDQEFRKYSKPIEENITKDFPYRETARQLEKLLRKQKVENLSMDLALKDFDEFMQNSAVFNVVATEEDAILDTSETRKGNLGAAIKEYEEKIFSQLSEPDGSSSTCNSPENSESTENNEKQRKMSASQEITLPIDFTYGFDTRKNKPAAPYKNKEKMQGERGIKDKTLKDSSSHEKNSKRELNVSLKRANENTTTEAEEKSNMKREDCKKNDSFCTNFTNDSGSFIIAQGKKLHLARLKSAKKTSKVKMENATNNFDEYLRPYEVLPLKEAKKLNKRDAKLVPTFDIKDRLKVNIPQFDEELIGVMNKKYLSQLATEWDEYYQKEILNRPRIRRFKPRTIMKQIVDSLRLKYESIYKREYLTEKSIIIEQEKLFTERAVEFRDFCMEFFSNLTTTNYRQSMAKIQDLRPMYELNDELTSELTTLQNQLIQLKTAIIRAEGKVREATILQNVSYLMKEPSWREKNDWIHKKPDGSLETIKESIKNRMTTNLRKRDNDSVWAIKEFFENNIFNKRRPALICFESPDAVIDTIADFKVQLYLSLLKLDLSTWTLMNLQHAYNTYVKWSTEFIANRKKYVEARCAKKYFLDVCATNMKKDAVELINGKLVETISEKTLRTLEPLCNTLFIEVVPKNIQDQLEGGDVLSKFRFIITHAMNMLERMDSIPSTKRKDIEKNIRRQNGFIQRRTIRAVDLETHIDKVRKVMIKHSTPPFKRPRRTGKHPRSHLNIAKPMPDQKIEQPVPDDDDHEMVRLTLTEQDFEKFLQETPTQNDYYLDTKFFGGDPDVPNMDFLPEIKSNINEFIIDVKNVLEKWERHKQERYLEDAHHTWTSSFGESS